MTLEELKKFCANEDDFRDYLQQPFTKGEWTYATNGRIAVRVRRINSVAEGDVRLLPKIDKVFEKTFSQWVPVPVVTIRPDVKCEICHGTTLECDLGNEHPCDACNETGKQSGYTKDHKTMIGETCFADQYLAMIQGWEISPDPKENMGSAGIRGNGATGVLMPRRP